MSDAMRDRVAVKEIHVAVAVIIRDGRVLVARRPGHAHQGGLLEFPGGKVEAGETVQQALIREIAEETGLRLTESALEPVIGIHHDYGDKQVFLDVWQTTDSQGEAEGREGQSVSWMLPETLRDEDFPAGNRAIIHALKLPRQLAITGQIDGGEGVRNGIDQLTIALRQRSVPLVVLRAPVLERPDYHRLAEAALLVCKDFGTGLIVHGSPAVFQHNRGLAGLHLPWREAEGLEARPISRDAWLGVSCHNAEQITHAARLEADYVTLGPVKPTASHPEADGIGWPAFSKCVALAPMPVYGLGGLGIEDVSEARRNGGQGIAGIRYWWPES
ncbi:MAG TPA: Nudix family hydrolase [Marinobacter sp.]|nr:Nudix family hydrolase [Marinobacter sp.]